jgi:hypothetical protein
MSTTIVPPVKDTNFRCPNNRVFQIPWDGQEPSLFSFDVPTGQIFTNKRTTLCFTLNAPRTKLRTAKRNGTRLEITDTTQGSQDRTVLFPTGRPMRIWLVDGVGTDRLSKPPFIDMSDLKEEESRTYWAHARQGGHCSSSTSPLANDDSESEGEYSDTGSTSA